MALASVNIHASRAYVRERHLLSIIGTRPPFRSTQILQLYSGAIKGFADFRPHVDRLRQKPQVCDMARPYLFADVLHYLAKTRATVSPTSPIDLRL